MNKKLTSFHGVEKLGKLQTCVIAIGRQEKNLKRDKIIETK